MISNQTLNRIDKFQADRDFKKFHTTENLAKCISIEQGELLECFQWGNCSSENYSAVYDELADVLIYALDMCSVLGKDPDELINRKLQTNEEKYPIDRCKGTAKKYTEL